MAILLTFKWNIEKNHKVVDHAQHRDADDRPQRPAPPAEQARAAEHRRNDRVELHAEACRGHRAADARRHDHSGQRRQDPAKDEGDEASSLHVQARQPPGRRVQTENEQAASECGTAQHEF